MVVEPSIRRRPKGKQKTDVVIELEVNGHMVSVWPISDETLECTAQIVGLQGAAGKALSELRARRRAGEDVAAFVVVKDNTILVGPKP